MLPAVFAASEAAGREVTMLCLLASVALDMCAGIASYGLTNPSLCLPTTPIDCVSWRLAKIESDHGADPPC
jgi:hypothetical protein